MRMVRGRFRTLRILASRRNARAATQNAQPLSYARQIICQLAANGATKDPMIEHGAYLAPQPAPSRVDHQTDGMRPAAARARLRRLLTRTAGRERGVLFVVTDLENRKRIVRKQAERRRWGSCRAFNKLIWRPCRVAYSWNKLR